MDPTELRMYLLVRGDLPDMTPGKLAAQAGHAFVALAEAARRSDPGTYQLYLESSNAKIVVKAKDDLALIRAHNECCGAKLVAVLITDQGRTCFGCPTMTVLAIGPTTRGELPKFVQRMQLL